MNSDAIPPGTAVNNYMLFGNQDNPFLKATEWNWQIDPLGFRTIITRYYNGLAACRCSRLKTASG
ncbi:putative family 1 glycoside hydrolase [Klebsiella pneumoniae]|uniref:Putative family 1 glycoside hydrolase n=1 Tax=Klebsiella pneumoniae TaxID=573 RepID=A0A377TTI2_KLEPN|nr:putative family 1 glycoside hydrolase [Klebsiella pneumoniae]